MKHTRLASTKPSAPRRPNKGMPLKTPLAFLASLALYLTGFPATANPGVTLPANPPGLSIDFRCELIDDTPVCPLDESNRIALPGPGSKYLKFKAVDLVCLNAGDHPVVANLFDEGIGVGCDGFDAHPGLDDHQRLQIFVKQGEGASSSTAMDGIYLNHLERGYWNGETCEPSTRGKVLVSYLDELDAPQPKLVIPWTSDTDSDGGEGCLSDDGHAIFVDFGGTRKVTSIAVEVTALHGAEGPVAAGIEAPNVTPECFDGGDGVCRVELVPNPLPGQDVTAIVDDGDLFGTVSALDGFPVRVLDPRDSCQAVPSGAPETLEFNGANIYSYYPPGSTGPGDEILGPLPLVVSAEGSTEYLVLSAKGCGVPRMAFNGPAVARGTPGSMPFFDVIAIESDIDPVDSLIVFESTNEAPYECKPGPVAAPLPVGAALDQPLGEINSRESEVKQLAGLPGIVDPMSRDKTQTCGSRRIGNDRFSFVVYSLIHNLKTDMRAELDDEITVMTDTVARIEQCVTSSFYYGQLVAYPGYIRQYYDLGVAKAEVECNAAQAELNFSRTATLVDRFTSRLELLGSSEFLRCYATGSNLDQIKESPPAVLAPGDKPLNAYGNIITQLQHLSYSLTTFINELTKLPDSCF